MYPTIFSQEYANVHAVVRAVDEPGPGGGRHRYNVRIDSQQFGTLDKLIEFQKGLVKEVGVNGVQNEHLLAMVIDRLQGFQSGPYACRENDMALARLQEAMFWLAARTKDRAARGVEGSSVA